jgi:two-component system, OmpR family, KDP operon response regulator KdpE
MTAAGTVLIVDDEPHIRRLLRGTLERAGYRVAEVGAARQVLPEVEDVSPDIVLLDLGLPDRDGLELLPLLAEQRSLPVLVVSAREATEEKVAALDLGAVDYVTKPFDTDELLARLRVALRHQGLSDASPKIVRRGDLSIDLDRRIVERAGEEVHLTRKEHDVLGVLTRHIGRVVTHERLLAACWGSEEEPRVEYLRIVIRNLRQKLEVPGAVGSVISNELGVGYRLKGEA